MNSKVENLGEKFHLKTFGCKFNQVDSRILREIFKKRFIEAPEKEADFLIVNSCGVVEKTERKIRKRILGWKREGKKILLTGCLALISPHSFSKIVDAIYPTQEIIARANSLENLFDPTPPYYHHPIQQKDDFDFFHINPGSVVAILAISEGCIFNCSFCATKFARGKLRSFPKEKIIDKIHILLENGIKEIQLTSQDLSNYGVDRGKWLLPMLLEEISKINKSFKVRLGMMHPAGAKNIFPALLEIMESDKFYKFLHLPLQSGNNRILKEMGRGYDIKTFLGLVERFRERFSESIFATDVIVGYPNEDDKAFKNTVEAIRFLEPEILHIFKYSKRPHTKAWYLKDPIERIKKERSRKLSQIWLKICEKKNRRYVGKKLPALITERRVNSFLARLHSYRAVILKDGEVGNECNVNITSFRPNYLMGNICAQ